MRVGGGGEAHTLFRIRLELSVRCLEIHRYRMCEFFEAEHWLCLGTPTLKHRHMCALRWVTTEQIVRSQL